MSLGAAVTLGPPGDAPRRAAVTELSLLGFRWQSYRAGSFRTGGCLSCGRAWATAGLCTEPQSPGLRSRAVRSRGSAGIPVQHRPPSPRHGPIAVCAAPSGAGAALGTPPGPRAAIPGDRAGDRARGQSPGPSKGDRAQGDRARGDRARRGRSPREAAPAPPRPAARLRAGWAPRAPPGPGGAAPGRAAPREQPGRTSPRGHGSSQAEPHQGDSRAVPYQAVPYRGTAPPGGRGAGAGLVRAPRRRLALPF